MANKLVLQKKIDSKTAKIEKANQKLNRLQGKLEGAVDAWDKEHLQYEISSLIRSLKVLEAEVEEYQKQLNAELEKDSKRNIKVLIEFLDGWKKRVRESYYDGIKDYYDTKEYADAEWEKGNKEPKFQFQKDYYPLSKWNEKTKKRELVKPGKWDDFLPYINSKTFEEAIARLDADIETDANRKYDTIVAKAEKKGGKILDGKYLYIGNTGEINGYLTCENRNVEVRTVGAGGHHIQCFHFRVLVL